MGTILAILVQSWRLRLDPHWRPHFSGALAIAIAAFVYFWIFALIRPIPRGLGEQAVIALVVLWLWRASWHLMRTG
jgi:hypothetical protein